MKKKLVVLFVAFCLMAVQTVTANAAKVVKFDREKALAYAEENWEVNGGDCVRFVRATMEAAGIPKDASKKGYTSKEYADYLIKNGYATKYELTWHWHSWSGGGAYYVSKTENASVPIEPGDVLLYKCSNPDCPKCYFHMAIVSENKEIETKPQYADYWFLYQHNSNKSKSGLNAKIVAYNCPKCGADKSTVQLYVLHMSDSEIIPKVTLSSVKTVKTKVKVTWENIEGESGYEISMSEDADVENIVANYQTTKGTNKSFAAKKGKTYYIKVRAYKTVDEVTTYGPWSKVKKYKRK